MDLKYDVSYIRHGKEVAIESLLELQPTKRALVKLESGKEALDFARLREYERIVQSKLAGNLVNYNLEKGLINDKWALVIERK